MNIHYIACRVGLPLLLAVISSSSFAAVINLDNSYYVLASPAVLASMDNDRNGYNENQGDCDDGNPVIHPGAVETCGDGSVRCAELIQWWGGTPSGVVHYKGYYGSPALHSGYLEEGPYNLGPTSHVGVALVSGTGPVGSDYEGRSGSYSGVFLCSRPLILVIDPFSEN